jgi:hypothetical protein
MGTLVKIQLALESMVRNPTDPGKHVVKLITVPLDSVVIERPRSTQFSKNICLHEGLFWRNRQEFGQKMGYISVRPRGEDIKDKNPNIKERRWVVEISHSRLN